MKTSIKSLTIALGATIFLLSANTGKAQSFDQGTSAINVGVGFGYSVDYYAGVSSTPVITASYEYGATKLGPGTLGLGLAVGYQGSSYTYSDGIGDSWNDKWTATSLGVRAMYHWDVLQSDKFDIYGGLQLTYVHFGYSYTATGPYYNYYPNAAGAISSSFYPYIIIGGRYYFSDHIGAFAELGYDLSYFKIGISFKF